jgi:hypothetical protein
MTNKYLVEPIKQPNWSSCWQTAMLMLDKWRRIRLGSSQLSPPELESVVYPRAKDAQQNNLFNRADIGSFLQRYRFTSRNIQTTPEAFAKLLAEGKPFGYVALAPNPAYQHTLVITGIQKDHRQLYTIYYNDPDPGRALHKEFYAFMREHIPAWGNDAFVVIPSN